HGQRSVAAERSPQKNRETLVPRSRRPDRNGVLTEVEFDREAALLKGANANQGAVRFWARKIRHIAQGHTFIQLQPPGFVAQGRNVAQEPEVRIPQWDPLGSTAYGHQVGRADA